MGGPRILGPPPLPDTSPNAAPLLLRDQRLQRSEPLAPELLRGLRRLPVRKALDLERERALLGPLRREVRIHPDAVGEPDAHRLRLGGRADLELYVRQPALAPPRVVHSAPQRLDRRRDRHALARFVAPATSLPDVAQPAQPLVPDGDRLRPPLADAVLLVHELRDRA